MKHEDNIQAILNTTSFRELHKVLDELTAEPSPSMGANKTKKVEQWRHIRFYARRAYRKLYEQYSEKYPEKPWPEVPLEKNEDSIVTVEAIIVLCEEAMRLERNDTTENSEPKPGMSVPLRVKQWQSVLGMTKKEFLAIRKAEDSIYHFTRVSKKSHRLVLPIDEVPDGYLKKYYEAAKENTEAAER